MQHCSLQVDMICIAKHVNLFISNIYGLKWVETTCIDFKNFLHTYLYDIWSNFHQKLMKNVGTGVSVCAVSSLYSRCMSCLSHKIFAALIWWSFEARVLTDTRHIRIAMSSYLQRSWQPLTPYCSFYKISIRLFKCIWDFANYIRLFEIKHTP